jgi:hypothetical protein
MNKKTEPNLIYSSLTDRRFADHRNMKLGNNLLLQLNQASTDVYEYDDYEKTKIGSIETNRSGLFSSSDKQKVKSTENLFNLAINNPNQNNYETKGVSTDLTQINKYKLIPKTKHENLYATNKKFYYYSNSNDNYNTIDYLPKDKEKNKSLYSTPLIKPRRSQDTPNRNNNYQTIDRSSNNTIESNDKVEDDDNKLKFLLDDNILNMYVKVLMKQDKLNKHKQKKMPEIIKKKPKKVILSDIKKFENLSASKNLLKSNLTKTQRKIISNSRIFPNNKHKFSITISENIKTMRENRDDDNKNLFLEGSASIGNFSNTPKRISSSDIKVKNNI